MCAGKLQVLSIEKGVLNLVDKPCNFEDDILSEFAAARVAMQSRISSLQTRSFQSLMECFEGARSCQLDLDSSFCLEMSFVSTLNDHIGEAHWHGLICKTMPSPGVDITMAKVSRMSNNI